MSRAERDGVGLHYATEGAGETVAFVGDLGYGAWQWGWQFGAVAGPFEALAWDLRGTGRSDCPPGPYHVETLAADLEAVLTDRGAGRAHLVGAGLGGMVALQYALTHGRARSLALLATGAGGPHAPDEPVERCYAPPDDPAALRETLRPVLTPAFFADQPDVVDGIAAWRAGRTPAGGGDDGGGGRGGDGGGDGGGGDGGDGDGDATPGAGDASRAGWEAQAAAVRGFDARDRLHEVTLPALVVHGTADALWPPAGGEALAAGLPRGRYEPVEGGPHLVGVERSREVNDLLVGFLEEQADW